MEVPWPTAEGLVTGAGSLQSLPSMEGGGDGGREKLTPTSRKVARRGALAPTGEPHRLPKLPPGRADLTAAPGSSASVTESHVTLRGQGKTPLPWATGEPRSFGERRNNYSLPAPCPFRRPFLLFCLFADFLKNPFQLCESSYVLPANFFSGEWAPAHTSGWFGDRKRT